MPDPAGIGRRINPRTPIRLACAAARRNVLVLSGRKRRRFLDPDHVVLKTEVSIDVLFILKMTGNDPRPILESQDTAIGGELVRKQAKQSAPQILEMLHVRFAHLP